MPRTGWVDVVSVSGLDMRMEVGGVMGSAVVLAERNVLQWTEDAGDAGGGGAGRGGIVVVPEREEDESAVDALAGGDGRERGRAPGEIHVERVEEDLLDQLDGEALQSGELLFPGAMVLGRVWH
ncbi:predicted protein [Aspergillus terreus NIH2624]|uniref:Uncharacterized protein n=1 Tax=Aspergillus terreus (strain NIH 2624 / FGSC A1156) TaxID=341663 RepID=Q0CGW0_ASPTN|nr:uncharacterized protein ATEG_07082 [Aspergillus terreus NIH2624]EAU32466.1 predicted protein [Aspergillus terreus NIH2624]